jgi:hypothetical protein
VLRKIENESKYENIKSNCKNKMRLDSGCKNTLDQTEKSILLKYFDDQRSLFQVAIYLINHGWFMSTVLV